MILSYTLPDSRQLLQAISETRKGVSVPGDIALPRFTPLSQMGSPSKARYPNGSLRERGGSVSRREIPKRMLLEKNTSVITNIEQFLISDFPLQTLFNGY